MRRCPLCDLALRVNDPGGALQLPPDNAGGRQPGFYVSVCSDCLALHDDAFAPQAVAVGMATSMSGRLEDYSPFGGMRQNVPAGLCAVCRRYAREDDAMSGLRLWREDLPEDEAARLLPDGQEHAHYVACGECRRKYAPAILRRLKQQGLVPPGLRPEQMGAPHFA